MEVEGRRVQGLRVLGRGQGLEWGGGGEALEGDQPPDNLDGFLSNFDKSTLQGSFLTSGLCLNSEGSRR